MGRMKPHVTHVLKYYNQIYCKPYPIYNLVGSSYRWGTDGGIHFEQNGTLVTKWAIGTYKWVGQYSIHASWLGIDHFVRFNQDYTEYESVRLGDLDYVKGKKTMNFFDENGKEVDTILFESVEQSQADEYITSDSVVLELGARYGTVSCVINKKLSNPLNQVSVEPDSMIWDCLEKNIKNNGCNLNLVKGVISRIPLELRHTSGPEGYENFTFKVSNSSIPNFTLEEIQAKYGLKFDTLVADCEGFLGDFFLENPGFYQQLKLVMFEKDSPSRCDYNLIIENLKTHGFTNLVTGFHEVWKK
jgi:hypothetical protein